MKIKKKGYNNIIVYHTI